MKSFGLGSHAISGGAALALLAGCGGSQPPIGAPGAMPQMLGVAPARSIVHRIGIASSYRVLHSFDSDFGRGGIGALIKVRGTFYGTTYGGGASKDGTVYSITAAGKRKVLHSFAGASADGVGPIGALVSVHGTMFGTTNLGGKCARGTVYSITTTGSEKLLHSFCDSDGFEPKAGLIYVNGLFYGTTSDAGTTGGTIYSISTAGAFKVLHNFGNSSRDGAAPASPLLRVNGVLYGTTQYGGGVSACSGDFGCGTVYSVTLRGKEKVLYRFQGGSDGRLPVAGLIDAGGTLYGTTFYGGQSACNCGTVYSVSTSGSHRVLYAFSGDSDGAYPYASLLEVSSVLYSTTYSGGSSDDGTIFSVTANGSEQVLHGFSGDPDGAHPHSNLTSLNGALYGTTDRGGDKAGGCGRKGCGTVFALTL